MSEIIPYVPNLTSTPENPSFKDCYYTITLDSLEAGEDAYTERRGIYETLKN